MTKPTKQSNLELLCKNVWTSWDKFIFIHADETTAWCDEIVFSSAVFNVEILRLVNQILGHMVTKSLEF